MPIDTPINYNPDVLTCLANLSNDEVFTPPQLVNQILDLLPPELWQNKSATFLDPVCKSGVFLREIAKRLNTGLAEQIPDQQTRINHIFKNQLYGIAITELTSLLSRRSVYCSKLANSKLSVCEAFADAQGNIIFDRIQHTWPKKQNKKNTNNKKQEGGDSRCIYCGANQKGYDRDPSLETHAYQFIHTETPQTLFGKDMKFDVIIGNPPYQLSDGGHGASAFSIYPQFVEQAIKLNPRYLCMIIPSRWFAGGGRGLPEFRRKMLNDNRVRIIHDFLRASDCFPGVEIKGGVNYFLWDRDNRGACEVQTHLGGNIVSNATRHLLEKGADTFIRYNEAISILRKVRSKNEGSFSSLVSANDPFGFDVRVEGSMKRVKPNFKLKEFAGSVAFYYNGWKKDGLGYIDSKSIRKNIEWMDALKILAPKAIGSGDVKTDQIKPIIPKNNSCCSETYIVIGPFKSKKSTDSVISYIGTKFFHFLVSLKKNTQESRRSIYEFVPLQDWNNEWSDNQLYEKYGLTLEEIDFIESMVWPMDSNNE